MSSVQDLLPRVSLKTPEGILREQLTLDLDVDSPDWKQELGQQEEI